MSRQLPIHRRASIVRIVVVAIFALVLVAANGSFAQAADLADQAHSLRKVPADVAFYSSSLRLKEQWDTFIKSKAYAKLMEIPLVQLGKMQVGFQWQQSNEPPIAQLREYLQSPAGQDAVAVLGEMFSDEIFAYGGSNIAESIKLFMEINSAVRTARMEAVAAGEDPEDAVAEKVMNQIQDKLSSGLTMPTFVMGFRIKDSERAKRELDEVHSQLRNVLDEHQPEIAAHLQRDQIAGHEFLTLRLDGSMIPWDKIQEDSEGDISEEQFNAIRDAISKQTLVVALGIIDEFVLLSVGDSTDHLAKMGQGSTLADQPAIKLLQKHAEQKAVSLTYVSKALAQSFGSAKQTLEDIAGAVDEAMVQGKLDEADRKLILDDIRALNLARYMPEPGEISMIGYLTARGYEAFQYNTTKRPMMDSSKPLSILKHVGGSPLLLIATRSKENVADYTQSVDWLKRIGGHIEQIAEKKSDPEDWAKYQEFRDRGIALLERLDQANREKLIPALADGQGAFVMDLAATSKKWFKQMPASPKPLPMLEMAFVAGVSDAEKLRQGVTTYIDVAQDAYKLAQEIEPKDVPDFELPKAKVSDRSGGGKLYTYPLPAEWGVDPQIAVNAGLTDNTAVVSLMPQTTERLLNETAASIDTSLPLDRPAAMITHIEFAKMIGATRPWINYGLDVATGKLKPNKEKSDDDSDDSDEDEPAEPPSAMIMQMGLVVPQVEQFLDVATTLRSATSVTYEEDGLWVTHSETHIEDLKEEKPAKSEP
jgi:hypothetical protein